MPHKIKRVVMVTPDIQIDRRIILEAKSLIEEGKEVILIAGGNGKMPEHEVLDGIKIKRTIYNGADPRLVWMYKINFMTMNLIAKASNKAINLIAKASNKAISSAARLILKSINLVSKVFGLITFKNGYEKFLANIVIYYHPDVVHVHDLPVLVAGVESVRKNNALLIYDSHELYTEEELPLIPKFWLKIKEHFFIKKANAVITVNPYLKSELETRYSVDNVSIIENATRRNNNFKIEKGYNLFRNELHLPEDSKIILYQGWFAPHRNLVTLVDGMKLLESCYYLILMGYGDYKEDLVRLINDIGMNERVIFVPAKTQEELLNYTASADIGVMPYLRTKNLNNLYSSPNKLYEFIAAGMPILANNLPYYKDIIEKYRNGIVRDMESPRSFANAVEEIFSMDLNTLRTNSLKAYKDLNWDNEGEKIKALYRGLEN